MSEREQVLQRQLDDAARRVVTLEERECTVTVNVEAPCARNALQSLSDWWHGGTSAGARSRHMRVNY